ncbi:ABC-2 type transporter-domain-containing protein [Peziza echinospora]|nr:ABC-2 type transporter-domain-containing protein [Peziza echinospora]
MVGESNNIENQRSILHTTNPRGVSNVGQHGVDVTSAEHDFMELSRQLSTLSRSASRRETDIIDDEDVEAATEKHGTTQQQEAETFDLESYLRGEQGQQSESGIKSKKIGVLWQDLTVSGAGGSKTYVATFPDAIKSFFDVWGYAKQIFGIRRKGQEIDILKHFRGVAKPGEMVLVLGRPGSGCTTFLKVIANQRDGYTKIDGDVLYGKIGADTFGKRYRGEAVYNEEDDVHHPTLTVGQTLSFALDTKTPAKRIPGVSKSDFKEAVLKLLLKMFNIEHTRNTIVGNQFVRGVSGGERKRVSIAEMMVTKATVCCWDNSTRGLDASTALDYAKSLRIMTNVYQTTTFVSLYQASESIYAQFDKVLVIDDGHEVFFGPTHDARSYFESLGFAPKPRQTTPDYLTGCTDEFEREYAVGRDCTNAPSTPQDLAKAFQHSTSWTKLTNEMEEYREFIHSQDDHHNDFLAAVKEDKTSGTPNKSVYTISFGQQVWALMKRQFLLKWQDKFMLVVGWVTTILIAIIVGTVFLELPETSAGAFTRGGCLFMSLLFNAFQAFSELPVTMMGRPIINKHRAYTFHRPSALWVANIAVDLIFAMPKIMMFCIITYFMAGLDRDAGAFFTFYLIIVCGYTAMALFFRTVGCVCPDFDSASKFACLIITLLVLTCGYLIPMQSTPVWLKWIFWINALGLAFSSMMINEFKNLALKCTGESLVPAGPSYNDMDHQSCTLAGSKPGTDMVTGADYLSTAFSYSRNHLWINFGYLIAQIAALLILNVIAGELFRFGAGGKTITFFQRPNAERRALNDALARKLQARRDNKDQSKEVEEADSGMSVGSEAVLTWEDLCYDVPTPSGELRLLKNIFGYVKPGQLTALMGSSGAGKTTLLDVLAARKNIGVITGDILIDGAPTGASFQRGTSYAEQLDIHESTQTVREALRFSAYLRQPFETSKEEKDAYVEEVIALLEMENIADAIIGNPSSGLAVEERKRVTIGVELAAKPQLLLFLDEPTSGLDSQSAFNIVRFLRKLANAGQTILCTIHQPNASLFEHFDRLLLLQRGGECVYFGDIGKDAKVLLDYFHRNGADCPPDANPAEWMLDAVGAGAQPRIGDRDWKDIWKESPELANVKEEIKALKAKRIAAAGNNDIKTDEYATPFLYQLQLVMRRTNLSFWRSPNYGFTRLVNHIVLGLLTGLCFLRLDNSSSSLQYRIFVIFQVIVLPAIIISQVEPMYDNARRIFYREQSSKMYSHYVFSLAQVIAEMPYSILCAFCFYVTLYFPPGLSTVADRAGYQFFIILIMEVFSVTLGQMLAALTPNAFIASLLNPFITIILSLFCGVTVPKPNMPAGWRYWIYELNPYTRVISGMIVTELHDLPVICNRKELASFTPPMGETCESYLQEFLSYAPGYLKNVTDSASDMCHYCAFTSGSDFLHNLELSWHDRWRDLGLLIMFCVSNIIILVLASRYFNFAKK